MKALVAGGTGLVGSAAAIALEKAGFEVVCLTRSGDAPAGRGLAGDVRLPGLGLRRASVRELRGVTHVVSCFGSVDWRAGPRDARDLHMSGTRSLLEFAGGCESLERFVHISSILALGRAEGRLEGEELELGQRFRSWYDYAKFLAEREVRREWPFPRRVLRLGPVLGTTPWTVPEPGAGLPAVVPFLLQGYPLAIERRGVFPSYVCDAMTAGEVALRALLEDAGPAVWTWFDDRMWSVAQVLSALCSAWAVVPRLVEFPGLRPLSRALARRVGVPPPLLRYAEPWVDVPATVLERLPGDLPRCPDGYLEATGAALRERPAELIAT